MEHIPARVRLDWPGFTLDAIAEDDHPGLVRVRIRIGESALPARLTKRSAAVLDLSPDHPVWVQVKSVALME